MSSMIADYFINSVKQTASSWAEILRVQFQMKRDRNEDLPTFMEVLNNFRQLCPANAVSNASPSSYGATLQGNPPEPPSAPPGPRHPRGNSPSVPSKECICGKMHWYSKYYYINESLRPNNWTPDPKIVKKVNEAIKDPQVKKSIENAKAKMIARRQASTPLIPAELPSESSALKIFATKWHHSDPITAGKHQASSYSVLKANNYDIVNCWILDSGSNIHVYNDSSRFKITHSTTAEDYLISGSTTYPIEAYGTVTITVTSPTGKEESIILS